MKKTLSILLLVLLVASLFVSCSSSPADAYDATVKITIDDETKTYYIRSAYETKVRRKTLVGPLALFEDPECKDDSLLRISFSLINEDLKVNVFEGNQSTNMTRKNSTEVSVKDGFMTFTAGEYIFANQNPEAGEISKVVINFVYDTRFLNVD